MREYCIDNFVINDKIIALFIRGPKDICILSILWYIIIYYKYIYIINNYSIYIIYTYL